MKERESGATQLPSRSCSSAARVQLPPVQLEKRGAKSDVSGAGFRPPPPPQSGGGGWHKVFFSDGVKYLPAELLAGQDMLVTSGQLKFETLVEVRKFTVVDAPGDK